MRVFLRMFGLWMLVGCETIIAPLSECCAQEMDSKSVATATVHRLFKADKGWMEVVVKSAIGPKHLGAPRSFYVHGPGGKAPTIVVVDEWTLERLKVGEATVVFDYRDRYESGFRIRVTAPIADKNSPSNIMRAVNLPGLRLDTLRTAIVNAIANADKIVLSKNGHYIELHRNDVDSSLAAYVRWYEDNRPPDGVSAAEKDLAAGTSQHVKVDHPSKIFDAFFQASQESAKPVFFPGDCAESLLKKHGLFLPSTGTVSGVLMYRDLSLVEIRVALEGKTFPIVASKGLKRSFIPKQFVRGVRRTNGHEFVVVRDSGAGKRYLYLFSQPFALSCPVADESEQRHITKLMANMADRMKRRPEQSQGRKETRK